MLLNQHFDIQPNIPTFQYSSIPIQILPDYTFAFHTATFDAVVHAELGPGHKEKQEMWEFGKRYGN